MLASPARRRMMRVISTARTNNSSLAERLRVRSAIRTRAIFRAANPVIRQCLNILIIRDAPSLAIRATTRMWARFTLHTLDCMPRPYALARNVASRYRSAPGRSGRGAFQGWGLNRAVRRAWSKSLLSTKPASLARSKRSLDRPSWKRRSSMACRA